MHFSFLKDVKCFCENDLRAAWPASFARNPCFRALKRVHIFLRRCSSTVRFKEFVFHRLSLVCATRFLNTYRLVRAGVPSGEWDVFRGDAGGCREFRIAMLLLSVGAGQPAVAREWFRSLRQRVADGTPFVTEGSLEERPEWDEFNRLYDQMQKEVLGTSPPSQVLTKWLDRVEIYLF